MAEKRNISYMYGNAAPKLEPKSVPSRKPQIQPVRPESDEQERRRQLKERRNLVRAKRMSALHFVLMLMATAMIFAMCAIYIQLQSELNSKMKQVASLETDLIALRTDNDIMEKRIETSIDLDEIKDRAMNELGMVYPSKDQVIYYQIDQTDYMEQYDDIPDGYEDTILGMMLNK